ncbi:MAG TPA: DUF4180 domain-containing protein [Candidatus Angelobacter sp.]|nr:DUF4180 domain-containing protein [Candidatus Angelobacter sp.]
MGLQECHGVRLLVCSAEGPKLRRDRDALELIGEAGAHRAGLVAVPVERFDPDFFHLKTRLAGEFLQKFVIYGVRVAIVGDLSAFLNQGHALQAFVRESNRGHSLWFVSSLDDLKQRLQKDADKSEQAR